MATTTPVRTTASKQLIEAVDAMLDQTNRVRASNTREGLWVNARLETLKSVRHLLDQYLPEVEVDAIARAMPGVSYTEASFLLGDPNTPSESAEDPTIPFAWDIAERAAEQDAVAASGQWSLR